MTQPYAVVGTAIVNIFFGETFYGATKRCTGWGGTHAGGSTGTVGGVPYGATKRCNGWVKMPNWICGTHAGGPIGGFGGAPYRATKRCIGWGERMRA
eukprot:7248142-Pyramimonas_sp.AAC.1